MLINKYTDYIVGFQEIPNETSLLFNLSNCPHSCVGCHSPYLAKDMGYELTNESLNEIIEKYNGMITCVCFMGGDSRLEHLSELCKFIKQKNLMVGIYSGNDDTSEHDFMLKDLDYLKIGHYEEKCGGLKSQKTNQHFYFIEHKDNEKSVKVDKTHLFWEE